jgi:SAM-dependent methyltransferase
MDRTPYDDNFFSAIEEVVLDSARVVVPILLELISPTSVLDVGCGRGAWLRAFEERGVKVLRGLDGTYVDSARLLVDPQCFTPMDLSSQSCTIAGRYDVALCLEVAEHLPAKFGDRLIEALTEAAPVVVFSAAVPGQGGIHHVNEQWPNHWTQRFAKRGFRMLDPLRPRVRNDARVAWFYRQNMLLYASDDAISGNPGLQRELDRVPPEDMEWVHMTVVRTYRNPKFWWKLGRQGLWRMIQRRVPRRGRP